MVGWKAGRKEKSKKKKTSEFGSEGNLERKKRKVKWRENKAIEKTRERSDAWEAEGITGNKNIKGRKERREERKRG